MMELSYRRHRFPPVVIQHAVWVYLRFTLSYRDVEDLLAERGLNGDFPSDMHVRARGQYSGSAVGAHLKSTSASTTV
jgi:hypothetical protein